MSERMSPVQRTVFAMAVGLTVFVLVTLAWVALEITPGQPNSAPLLGALDGVGAVIASWQLLPSLIRAAHYPWRPVIAIAASSSFVGGLVVLLLGLYGVVQMSNGDGLFLAIVANTAFGVAVFTFPLTAAASGIWAIVSRLVITR